MGLAKHRGMMMLLKITDTAAIDAALSAANGRASTHTYKSAHHVQRIADVAEARLAALGVPKAQRAGATVAALSGSKLPSAYKYTPVRTRLVLTRRSSAWYVTDIQTGEFLGTPGAHLALTEAQDAAAIAHFRSNAGKLT